MPKKPSAMRQERRLKMDKSKKAKIKRIHRTTKKLIEMMAEVSELSPARRLIMAAEKEINATRFPR